MTMIPRLLKVILVPLVRITVSFLPPLPPSPRVAAPVRLARRLTTVPFLKSTCPSELMASGGPAMQTCTPFEITTDSPGALQDTEATICVDWVALWI